MDPASLAAAGVATLKLIWDAGAAEAAKSAARDFYAWLKGKLAGAPAESLAKLEAEPAEERNVERLKADLEELFEKDPGFAEELAKKLAQAQRAGGVQMELVLTGDHNIGVQAVGSTVKITR
ncbi:MAG: hypothetical protein NZ704_14835 [Geminicoccaceae bacterium]|nr:hypothetical protein [Geminicoccaceae bacterium]